MLHLGLGCTLDHKEKVFVNTYCMLAPRCIVKKRMTQYCLIQSHLLAGLGSFHPGLQPYHHKPFLLEMTAQSFYGSGPMNKELNRNIQ